MRVLEGLLARLRRPAADPRLTAAREAHAAGNFVEARRLVSPIVARGNATLEAVRGLAELEYLLGDYLAAENLLRRVVEESGSDVATRVDAEVALALVYLQTNRYTETHGLFAGVVDAVELPIWELMRSFGDETPYRIDWPGGDAVTVPFTQTTDWELPCVAIEVDGRQVEARLDTGGELLTLSRDVAEAVGVEAVVTATGVFAGGAQGELSYGRVEAVTVGGLTVRGVPVAVVDLDRPVIGTGFLVSSSPRSTIRSADSCSVLAPTRAGQPSVLSWLARRPSTCRSHWQFLTSSSPEARSTTWHRSRSFSTRGSRTSRARPSPHRPRRSPRPVSGSRRRPKMSASQVPATSRSR